VGWTIKDKKEIEMKANEIIKEAEQLKAVKESLAFGQQSDGQAVKPGQKFDTATGKPLNRPTASTTQVGGATQQDVMGDQVATMVQYRDSYAKRGDTQRAKYVQDQIRLMRAGQPFDKAFFGFAESVQEAYGDSTSLLNRIRQQQGTPTADNPEGRAELRRREQERQRQDELSRQRHGDLMSQLNDIYVLEKEIAAVREMKRQGISAEELDRTLNQAFSRYKQRWNAHHPQDPRATPQEQ
jgi:hypothetical protein